MSKENVLKLLDLAATDAELAGYLLALEALDITATAQAMALLSHRFRVPFEPCDVMAMIADPELGTPRASPPSIPLH